MATSWDDNTWEDKVKTYYQVDQEQKDFKKKRDSLNSELKKAMGSDGTKEVGDLIVELQTQERVKMDEDITVDILKKLGHTGAIKTVEVPDEKAVEELLFHGSIDAKDLEKAQKVQYVEVLKVNKKKKKKKEEPKNAAGEVF